MKRLICEICGESDFIKQDGKFVCQNCGAKYSVEEARRMMIEPANDVSVMKYCENISAIDTNSLEALKDEQYVDIDNVSIGENHNDLQREVQENTSKESGDDWNNFVTALVVVGYIFVVCLLIKWLLG